MFSRRELIGFNGMSSLVYLAEVFGYYVQIFYYSTILENTQLLKIQEDFISELSQEFYLFALQFLFHFWLNQK